MKPAARAVALVAMAGTLCAASVFAEESAVKPTSNKDASSMRVVVDPETGEVRAPTQEELLALIQAEQAVRATQQTARAARSAQAAAPTDLLPEVKSVQRHPNGMLSVKLPQDSLSLVTVVTDEQGKTRTVHSETSSVAPAQEQ